MRPTGLARLAGGAALLAFGCNAVLGIEEARVDPALADGGTGGQAGSGGISEIATGGHGASGAGTGGHGASGAGAGGHGASDMGGGGHAAVACGDVGPDNERLVRSCVLRASCHPLVPRFTISDCIALNIPGISNYEFCTQDARTCADIENCTGFGYLADASTCEGVTSQWICDGNVGIRCGATRPYTVDCGRLGATCVPYRPGAVADTSWPCLVAIPTACESPDSTWMCNGDTLYHCIEGAAYGMACSRVRSICNEDLPGAAYCNDITATCTERGVVRCDGDAVTVCDTSGYFARYDCAPAGGFCDTDGTSVGYCILPGCNKDSECEEECLDDRTMKLCVGGAPVPVDCTRYGFSECGVYRNPTTQADYVLCK
jgi:hypothetical protein